MFSEPFLSEPASKNMCQTCTNGGFVSFHHQFKRQTPTKSDQNSLKNAQKSKNRIFPAYSLVSTILSCSMKVTVRELIYCSSVAIFFFTFHLVRVTAFALPALYLDNDPTRSRIFRNPSNFDELYLRAQ